MSKTSKNTSKPKQQKDVLRAMLEAIYWAATDGSYFTGDEEELRLEDFSKVARAVDHCILPDGREYLAGVRCADAFVTIDKLVAHLRCNLGPQWGMEGI